MSSPLPDACLDQIFREALREQGAVVAFATVFLRDFAHANVLEPLFEQMGFKAIARHRHKRVTLYRQGGINFILNAEPDSFAQRFARQHGPSICAIAFRVQDAGHAYKRALELGAWGFDNKAGPMELNIPAIKGIGDSLIYFVDRWHGKDGAKPGAIGNISIWDVDVDAMAEAALAEVQAEAARRQKHQGGILLLLSCKGSLDSL